MKLSKKAIYTITYTGEQWMARSTQFAYKAGYGKTQIEALEALFEEIKMGVDG